MEPASPSDVDRGVGGRAAGVAVSMLLRTRRGQRRRAFFLAFFLPFFFAARFLLAMCMISMNGEGPRRARGVELALLEACRRRCSAGGGTPAAVGSCIFIGNGCKVS